MKFTKHARIALAAFTTAPALGSLHVETLRDEAEVGVAFDSFNFFYFPGLASGVLTPGYAYSDTFNSTQWSLLNNASIDYAASVQHDDSAFHVGTSLVTSGSLSTPVDIGTIFITTSASSQHLVTVTENARLRFTFEFTNAGVNPEFLNSYLLQITSSSGVTAPIAAGFGRDDNSVQIDHPFSFEIDALAGEQFNVAMQQNFVFQSLTPAELNSWSLLTSTSFSVEVVPAPGSLALLAGGCLVASRRRRI